jgi:putative ABC transport system permease protein
MKYLPFLWANLWRSKTRTGFTLASIAVSFMLYGMLQAVNVAFQSGPKVSGTNRLITGSKLSITESLPLSYYPQIAQVAGVVNISHSTWFGGYYQDPKQRFPTFAVDAQQHFKVINDDVRIPEAQVEAFQRDKASAIAGRNVADRYGWKIGDRIPIQADIWVKKNGERVWTFNLVGIFDVKRPEEGGRANTFYIHHDYFDEARAYQNGTASLYLFNIDDPKHADTISQTIDAMFENTSSETKTQTEQAFSQAFAKQIGDIGLMIQGILAAVFFTILILTGNTLMQSVRERVPELAVLKSLGFSDGKVWASVLFEAVLLCGSGALVGLGLATVVLKGLKKSLNQVLPSLSMPAETWGWGVLLALMVAVLVGLPPAYKAWRLSIVDALAGR